MLLELAQRAPVQRIVWSPWAAREIEVSLWRLDQLDPSASGISASGNKLFKLAENLQAARQQGHSRILSFGGAFSNHIHALALSGRAAGFETIGVIRGESSARINPTLSDAAAAGMQLHFVNRETYRAFTQNKHADKSERSGSQGLSREGLRELEQRFGRCYVIPEGGANLLGVQGCRALGMAIKEMPERPDIVVLPTATGSTLAGLVAGLENRCHVRGIAVLKGGSFIADQIRGYLRECGAEQFSDWPERFSNWKVELDYHGGGYARTPEPLRRFVADFTEQTGVDVEPVYSGKMLYAIHQLIERGEFTPGARLLAVHTGGMQGARGACAVGHG